MELTVGKIAKEAGVNTQTVLYYERRRLIPEAKRSSSGYRKYSSDIVRRILFIKRAQDLGFSLREIQELLNLRLTSFNTCLEVRQKAEAKINEIDQKIRSLKKVRAAILRLKANCGKKKSPTECPLLDELERF